MAKATEKAVRFLLTHHSHLPQAEGVAGQVIEIRRDLADRLAARGGGRIFNETLPVALAADHDERE